MTVKRRTLQSDKFFEQRIHGTSFLGTVSSIPLRDPTAPARLPGDAECSTSTCRQRADDEERESVPEGRAVGHRHHQNDYGNHLDACQCMRRSWTNPRRNISA